MGTNWYLHLVLVPSGKPQDSPEKCDDTDPILASCDVTFSPEANGNDWNIRMETAQPRLPSLPKETSAQSLVAQHCHATRTKALASKHVQKMRVHH